MKYSTILFDNDDTLLDFKAAEYAALKKMMIANGLPFSEEMHRLYSECNLHFWKAFERGEIEKKEIFVGRFEMFLQKANIVFSPEEAAKGYEGFLAFEHPHIEDSVNMCRRLKEMYKIYIVTNGSWHIQKPRIHDSGLEDIMDGVFVSEKIGIPKPHKEYFDYVFSHIEEKNKQKILIVGDSITSDIQGGINAGIDTCWFNPKHTTTSVCPTYEFDTLSKIEDFLKHAE